MFLTETISCLLQIFTLRGCEERIGDQKDKKVVCTVATVVDEKVHLGTKRHLFVKKSSL